jgi:hypothetical protein
MSNINTLPVTLNTASTYFIVSDRGLASRFAYTDLTSVLQKNALTAPVTSTSTGVAGNIAYDSTYFYVCVSTNTWKRVLLSTF